jgi:haloalkane dehalogenase
MTTSPVQTLTLDDGTTLGYRELGSGPAVVLLHGWPTSSYLWRHVTPALAASNRVLALDMPGFGASDKPAGSRYDFGQFEAALDGFLAGVGVGPDEPIGIVGHDLGGPIAVHWMLSRPGRVSRLALLNTLLYPEFSEAVVEFVMEFLAPDSRAHRVSDAGLREVMDLGITDPALVTDDLMAAVLAPFSTPEARESLADAAIGLAPAGFEEIAAGLSSIDVPVRVVYGEDDKVLPDVAETFTRLAKDVPHTEVTVVPGCGHFIPEQNPTAVTSALAPFFTP